MLGSFAFDAVVIIYESKRERKMPMGDKIPMKVLTPIKEKVLHAIQEKELKMFSVFSVLVLLVAAFLTGSPAKIAKGMVTIVLSRKIRNKSFNDTGILLPIIMLPISDI